MDGTPCREAWRPGLWVADDGAVPPPNVTGRAAVPAPGASTDARQFLEGVEGRRAASLPFQRRRTLAPVVVGQVVLRGEGPVDDIEEDEHGRGREVGAHRGDHVPAPECIGVV